MAISETWARISRRNTGDDGTRSWTVTRHDGTDEWTTRYRTNQHGEGLWTEARSNAWYPDGTPAVEWKQVAGTAQFSGTRTEIIRWVTADWANPTYDHEQGLWRDR